MERDENLNQWSLDDWIKLRVEKDLKFSLEKLAIKERKKVSALIREQLWIYVNEKEAELGMTQNPAA